MQGDRLTGRRLDDAVRVHDPVGNGGWIAVEGRPPTPASTTSAQTTTTATSTPTPNDATTSANSKHSATTSPSNPQPEGPAAAKRESEVQGSHLIV